MSGAQLARSREVIPAATTTGVARSALAKCQIQRRDTHLLAFIGADARASSQALVHLQDRFTSYAHAPLTQLLAATPVNEMSRSVSASALDTDNAQWQTHAITRCPCMHSAQVNGEAHHDADRPDVVRAVHKNSLLLLEREHHLWRRVRQRAVRRRGQTCMTTKRA